MFEPRWVVACQSLSQSFVALVENLAESFGPCVIMTGAEVETARPELIAIRRMPKYDRRGTAHRIASWVRYLYSVTKVLAGMHRDIFVLTVTNPPIMPHVALALHGFRGNRYGIIFWDIYPDHLIQSGILSRGNPVCRLWRLANRMAMSKADVTITIGDRMAQSLRSQLGSLEDRTEIIVIENFVDVGHIRPIPKEENPFAQEHGQMGRITVLYAGNMGATHGLDNLVAAAGLLKNRNDISFLLVGSGLGRNKLEKEIARRSLENIKIIDKQPWNLFPSVIAAGDIAVVSQALGTEHLSVPSKTYTAMAAGCAILAITSPDSDLGRLVSGTGIGKVVANNDPTAIAATIDRICADRAALALMKAESRRVVIKKYDIDEATRTFREAMEKSFIDSEDAVFHK